MVIIWVKDSTGFQTKKIGQMQYNALDFPLKHDTFADFQHLDVRMHAVTVIREYDKEQAHWYMIFHTNINHLIRAELIPDGYRVIYGADYPTVRDYMVVEKFLLPWQHIVRDIFSYIYEFAIEFGSWSLFSKRCKPYGCKDFVINSLKNFGVPDRYILPYELRKTVCRRCPPLITEYDDNYNEVPAYGEPIIYTSRALIHSR